MPGSDASDIGGAPEDRLYRQSACSLLMEKDIGQLLFLCLRFAILG
jgi:hypothetical protein